MSCWLAMQKGLAGAACERRQTPTLSLQHNLSPVTVLTKHEEVATIKQIVHPRAGHPGVAEDAVLYVPVDATGAIPKAFIEPPEEHPGSQVNERWTTKTHITVNGETLKGGSRWKPARGKGANEATSRR